MIAPAGRVPLRPACACGARLRPIDASRVATEFFTRTCRACGLAWRVRVDPLGGTPRAFAHRVTLSPPAEPQEPPA